MYYDFNLHEKNLDVLIDLLQKNQLDENINLEPIEKMCTHFQTIYKNYLTNEKLDEIIYLNDLTNFGKHSCESITIDLQRLTNLIDVYFLCLN
jgi:dynactin 1